jgi:hypothetical protein
MRILCSVMTPRKQQQKQYENAEVVQDKKRFENATYDMTNGLLSKPLTLWPLHDVSVVMMRT